MDTIKKQIEKEIADFKKELETYDQYREYDGGDEKLSIVEIIESLDLDNLDFNAGFEQGYLRGLEVSLSIIK